MANSSVFPTQIDSFPTWSEIPASERANLATYQSLLQQSTLTPSQQAQLTSLTEELAPYLVSSANLNLITDAIVNVEQFFLQNVSSYFDNFKYLGQWSQSTSYQEWNTVTFNNQSYLSLKSPNLNNPPDTSTSYWALIAKQGGIGPQGPAGAALSYVGTYNNLSTYQQNQLVSYNGSTYICLQNNTTGYDPTNTTYWTLFVTGATPQAQNSAPTNPVTNQLWIDTTTAGDPLLKYWNGSAWVVVSPDQPVSDATTSSVGLVEVSDPPSGAHPVAVTTDNATYKAIFQNNETRATAPDLNTYKTAGIYALGGTLTNGPSGLPSEYGTLTVTVSADVITQTIQSFGGHMYYRQGHGTPTFAWGSWITIQDSSNGVTSVNGQTGAVTVQGYNPLTNPMAWIG